MRNLSTQKIYFVLRIAAVMCFIGHGAFGIITKPIWCNYFAVFGIGHATAYRLMPLVGSADILLGLVMLFYPVRAIALWLIIWGMITASLRPLSGEPFAELIERAGNFGAPMALLLLCGGAATFKGWFTKINMPVVADEKTMQKVRWCLKMVVFLLLAGHGWLNLLEKKSLLAQYYGLGFSNPANTARVVGIAEVAAAFTVWVDALSPLLLVLLVWKISTELLYPHYELFEFVERGGSYGTLFALWLIQQKTVISFNSASHRPVHS